MKSFLQEHYFTIFLIVALAVTLGYGYAMNIVLLFDANVDLTSLELKDLIRVVGIFLFPLGCLLGYIN